MPIKPELRWVPRVSTVDAWLRLPSERDHDQPIFIRLDEITGIRPLGTGPGAEVSVARGYFRTSASVETVEGLVARSRAEAVHLAEPLVGAAPERRP